MGRKSKIDHQINIFCKDFKNICRLCLSTKQLQSVFADPEFIITFKYITNIKVKETDELPKNVCVNCIAAVENIASFIKTCKNNDAILKAIVFQEEDKSLAPPESELTDTNLEVEHIEEILVQVEDEEKNQNNVITLKIVEDEVEADHEESESTSVVFQKEHKLFGSPELKLTDTDMEIKLVEETSVEVEDERKREEESESNHEENEATAIKHKSLALPQTELTDTNMEIEPVEKILVHVNDEDKNEDNIITLKIIEEKSEPNQEENEALANGNFKIGKHVLKYSDKIFPCKQCNKKFSRLAQLRNHIYNHKKDNKTLTCDKCNKPFLTITALRKHTCILSKSRLKPTSDKKKEIRKKRNDMCLCVYCNKYLTRKYDLKRHLRTHTGVKLFTCEVCGKKLAHKSALIRHSFLHTERFQCDACDKRFTRKSQLKKHIEKNHDGPLSCSFCTKQFKSNLYLRLHMKIHTGKANFTCDVCQKVFALRVSLNRHYLTHTGIKEFTCDKCDAAFNLNSLLNKHKKCHEEDSEEKSNLTCADCGKYFLFPSLLQRHKLVHDPNKTISPKPKLTTPKAPQEFLCSYCGKKFSYACNLKVHVKTHMGVRFTCEICQNSYSKRESLKNHLLAHKDEKPCQCPYCGKEFRKPSFYKHLLIHKGEKKFECSICSKSFIRKDHLDQHLRIHIS